MTAWNGPTSSRTFERHHARLRRFEAACFESWSAMERETGIEPALVAWKATVLPLNYSRAGRTCLGIAPALPPPVCFHGGRPGPVAASHLAIPFAVFLQAESAPADSSNRSYPGGSIHPGNRFALDRWWREVDSNHRRRKPADLQSAPVGRLGIPPFTEPRIFLAWGCQCQGAWTPKERAPRESVERGPAQGAAAGRNRETSASIDLDNAIRRCA